MNLFPYTLIDLTHTLDEDAPTWDGHCGFTQEITNDYGMSAEFVPFPFRVQQITLRSGMGTHIDAPAHSIPGGLTIDQLSLSNLVGPCSVIDISKDIKQDATLSLQDVQEFEEQHGTLEEGSIVMVRTGWDSYWNEPLKYRNNNVFPSISAAAAELFLERKVAALGSDTPSPDRPADGYPVHTLFLKANKYIIENATHLELLPPKGSFVMCLPLKARNGTEGPVRFIGLIKK